MGGHVLKASSLWRTQAGAGSSTRRMEQQRGAGTDRPQPLHRPSAPPGAREKAAELETKE